MEIYPTLSSADKAYIDHVRGALILRVVLVHLGLAWFYLPYSSYVGMFFSTLFCVSGIVSFYSYQRAGEAGHYLLKRLTRILVTFYIISGLAYLIVFAVNPHFFSINQLVNWLLVNPETRDQPYPMGQIWFLRSLVLLTIFVLPFFYLAKKNIHYLLVPVLISLVLAGVQQTTKMGYLFIIDLGSLKEINLYQPLVNMGYFCFGAWACYSGFLRRASAMLILAVCGAVTAISLYYAQRFSLDLADHAFYQDLFYLSLGYAGIGLIFGLRNPIASVIARIGFLQWMLNFFSYHAFSIFMIHSFFVYFSEVVFGWKGLDTLAIIIAKISFVVIASCLSAVPLSYICKKITNWIVRHVEARSAHSANKHTLKSE